MKKKKQKTDLPLGRKSSFGMKLFACAFAGSLLGSPLAAQTLTKDTAATEASQQAVTVTGVVLDALDDSPMIGVNVLIVNAKGG